MASAHISPCPTLQEIKPGYKLGRATVVRVDDRTTDGVVSASVERATAERSVGSLALYANMVVIAPPAAEKWAAIWSRRDRRPPDAKRGVIRCFSAASRRRFIESMMKWRDVPTHFITLTYPDTPDADVKRDLDVLKKRLARSLPSVSGFWRVEWKPRQTGAMRGVFMPHLHLVLHIPSEIHVERAIARIRRAWLEVVGYKQYPAEYRRAMRQHGFHAVRLASANGAMFYVSKYAAKVDASPSFAPGRAWGKVGQPNMARLTLVHVAQNAWHAIARAAAAAIQRRVRPDSAMAIRLARKEYLYTRSSVWAYGMKARIEALRRLLIGRDLSLLDIAAAIRALGG